MVIHGVFVVVENLRNYNFGHFYRSFYFTFIYTEI